MRDEEWSQWKPTNAACPVCDAPMEERRRDVENAVYGDEWATDTEREVITECGQDIETRCTACDFTDFFPAFA